MARSSKDSVEARILEILRKKYPITMDEVRKELRLNPRIVARSVRKLVGMGYVELDILPDKTYIRLLVIGS